MLDFCLLRYRRNGAPYQKRGYEKHTVRHESLLNESESPTAGIGPSWGSRVKYGCGFFAVAVICVTCPSDLASQS